MTPDALDPRLGAAVEAARAAGAVAMRYFRTDLTVERKQDHSPVTVADRECEHEIVRILTAATPGVGFFGEETGEHVAAGKDRWIIDPIDGTKSFIRGIPFFATLIGLEEAGEITLGVIHSPATGELLYGARGKGAYDENGHRLTVTSIDRVERAMVSFGGMRIFQREGLWSGLEAIVERSARQRGFGDYLGSAMVIRGWSEAMLELDVKPWDLAPLKLLAEEAGGRMTDVRGEATIYGGSAVVTNGHIHDELLELLHR